MTNSPANPGTETVRVVDTYLPGLRWMRAVQDTRRVHGLAGGLAALLMPKVVEA